MKKISSIILTFFLCITLVGCHHTPENFDVLSAPKFDEIISPTVQEETEDDPAVENEEKNDFYFEDQEFESIPVKELDNKGDYEQTARTYTELMEKLETQNGIIVSGKAYGLRKRYYHKSNLPFTETSFQIEKTYYGTVSEREIIIIEPYTRIEEKQTTYIEYAGPQYSMLKDNQKVLMFLLPYREGVYYPCYYELPLPEDYQDYDETAQKELLDFYRGNKEMYPEEFKDITPGVQKEVIELPGGAVEERYILTESPYWPERDISDEALLEEMSEHILVRLATEYKIKIWPENHIRFSSVQDRLSAKGIRELSTPKDPVATP